MQVDFRVVIGSRSWRRFTGRALRPLNLDRGGRATLLEDIGSLRALAGDVRPTGGWNRQTSHDDIDTTQELQFTVRAGR